MTISIIVPVYYGKKYIKDLISQAEKNAENVACEVELLLVNDAPDNPIEEKWNSDFIQISVINTTENRGIHGTRVRGLENAKGDYILFLDQDDRISSDCIKKQLVAIEDADAVVCKASQNHMEYYYGNRILEECIRKEYMTQKGNYIISPGQVLIRRAAIPEFWQTNILKHNGADDWFLWICMLCSGKRFVCNQEIIFEHSLHTENTSANAVSMLNSMKEVYDKLTDNNDCTERELRGIYRIIEEHVSIYIKERDKLLEFYFLLDDWMAIREQNISVADYIHEQGYQRVSIYGKGRIGLRLAKELQSNLITVSCFIDQNAEVLGEGIKTIPPEEIEDLQQPIIITLAKKDAMAVSRSLEERGATRLYFLADIIRYLKKQAIGRIDDMNAWRWDNG